jgi:predicted transglutaminase-like cysteine proteinase
MFGWTRRRTEEAFAEGALASLELELARGAIDPRNITAIVEGVAKSGDAAEVSSVVERFFAAGCRDREFLELAYRWAREERLLDRAHRYAEALWFEAKGRPNDLFRLARVSFDRGHFAISIAQLQELHELVVSKESKALEMRCWIRLGHPRNALLAYEQSSRPDSELEQWLRAIVERGQSPLERGWHGRRATQPHKMARLQWRERVLRARLGVSTRTWADVDRFINRCVYVPDERLFGTADHWQTPGDFEQNCMGDCEDFALWTWVQLLRQNVNARFVVGACVSWKMNHAWVTTYGAGGRVRVIECTPQGYNAPIEAKAALEYAPLFSVDRSLTWYAH